MSAAPIATVLVPTHDHGPLLTFAVRTALQQSVRDIEIFIVGDGMDDATRAAALELQRGDDRVRVFEHPKGPRHGELHRHAALQYARGRIVCYLCDDDLWFPEHVETLSTLLETADFAHVLPLRIEPDGSARAYLGHLAVEGVRERMQQLWNFIPLSCAAHTMALYRRLPCGWRTSPPDVWTDLYMFRQILAAPDCRAVSSSRLTALHFASPPRRDWTMEQRIDELTVWSERLADRDRVRVLYEQVIDDAMRSFAARELGAIHAEDACRDAQARATALEIEVAAVREMLASAEARGDRLAEQSRASDDEVARMRRTITWRMRGWLLRRRWLAATLRRLTRRGPAREGP